MLKASKNLTFRRGVFAKTARRFLPRYKAVGVILVMAQESRDNAKSIAMTGEIYGARWLYTDFMYTFGVEV